ncbi:MAG: molecular chaperone DjiA [Parvularculaceae bacterium]|nr:MAG: molecular chaperone DjiA [Parvularculaceae bacterium]
MNIWENLGSVLEKVQDRTFGAVFDAISAAKTRRDETAFSVALIALSAKLAKADGIVTDDEIQAFRDFFAFPESEARKVKMIYELAQQDVAGFDHYLRKVRRLFAEQPAVLEDVIDCLFHVAAADGVAHPHEIALLEQAAEIFDLSAASMRRIKAAHLGAEKNDPFIILDVQDDVSVAGLQVAYRALAREHHPDALIARGVPVSLVKIAEGRMAAINDAYDRALKILESRGIGSA